MHILVISNSKDLTVDSIINNLTGSFDIFRLNIDRFQDYDLKVLAETIILTNKITNISVNIKECYSMYFRKIALPDLSQYETKYQQLMQKEIITIVEGIAEIAGEIALTRPSILRIADNKIVQIRLAKDLGFNLPESLITNSNQAAQSFINSYNSSIVKPISVGKVYSNNTVNIIQTNMIDSAHAVSNLDLSPAYFQSYIPKDFEVRLNIINNKLFGVRIDSTNKIDWRKDNASINYSKIEVPKEIEDKCILMMNKLNLKFAIFDFIVSNNQYIFLELNANGQWQWLDTMLELGIEKEIIKYLTGVK